MPFDVSGALKAGYTQDQIIDKLAQDHNFDLAGARKAGYSDQDILGSLASRAPPFAPSKVMSEIPAGASSTPPGGKPSFLDEFLGPASAGAESAARGFVASAPYLPQIFNPAVAAFGGTPVGDLAQMAAKRAVAGAYPSLDKWQQAAQAHTPTDKGFFPQVERLIGGAIPAVAGFAINPVAGAVGMAAQQAGGYAQDAQALGKQPTEGGLALSAALGGAMGAIPGVGGVGRGLTGGIENAFLRIPARMGINAAVMGGVGGAGQVGQNIINQQTINPNQSLTQGVGQAALGMGAFGALHGLFPGEDRLANQDPIQKAMAEAGYRPSQDDILAQYHRQMGMAATDNFNTAQQDAVQQAKQQALYQGALRPNPEQLALPGNDMLSLPRPSPPAPEELHPAYPRVPPENLTGSGIPGAGAGEGQPIAPQVTNQPLTRIDIASSLYRANAPDDAPEFSALSPGEKKIYLRGADTVMARQALGRPVGPEVAPLPENLGAAAELKPPEPGSAPIASEPLRAPEPATSPLVEEPPAVAPSESVPETIRPGIETALPKEIPASLPGQLPEAAGPTLEPQASLPESSGPVEEAAPSVDSENAASGMSRTDREDEPLDSIQPNASAPEAQAENASGNEFSDSELDARKRALYNVIKGRSSPAYEDISPETHAELESIARDPENKIISDMGDPARINEVQDWQRHVDLVTAGLRQRLSDMGLGDIGVRLTNYVKASRNGVVYGQYSPENKLIRLGGGLYKPGLSAEELGSRLANVMDHEVIHAVKDMGLFTDKEWNTLTNEASARKMPVSGAKKGDPSAPTYLERAMKNYPDISNDQQKEEAVAEMFRDWAAANRKVNSIPTGLMSRMFNTLMKVVRGVGRSKVDSIFQDLDNGTIGGRDRINPNNGGDAGYSGDKAAFERIVPPSQLADKSPDGVEKAQASYARGASEARADPGPRYSGPQAERKDLNHIAQYGAISQFMRDSARVLKFKPIESLGLKAIAYYQDGQYSLAEFVKKLADAGDAGISKDDPKQMQTVFKAKAYNMMRTLADTIATPMWKRVGDINATKGDVNKLQGLLPNGGFVKALQDAHPKWSPSVIIANAAAYASYAEERNGYIRGIDPTNDAGSGMPDAEAKIINKFLSTYQGKNAIDDVLRYAGAARKSMQATRIATGLSPDWDAERTSLEAEQHTLFDKVNNVALTDTERQRAYDRLAQVQKQLKVTPNSNNYFPVRGHLDGPEDDIFGPDQWTGTKSLQVKGREDPRALGRTSYADDPLGTMLDMTSQSYLRGEKNLVAQSIGRAINRNPELAKDWITFEKPPMMKVMGSDGQVTYKVDPSYRQNASNYYSWKENGQEVWTKIHNDELRVALKGLDDPSGPGPLGRFLEPYTHFLGQMAAHKNPLFAPKLLFRHTGQAVFNSLALEPTAWSKILTETPKALSGFITRDPKTLADFEEMRKMGGASGLITGKDPMNQAAKLRDEYAGIKWADMTPAERAVKAVSYMGKVGDLAQTMNNHAEWSTRLGVYNTFKSLGYSPERSAAISRELTIDFDRSGYKTNSLTSLYMFANATIQGNAALARALITSGRARAAIVGLMAIGASQAALGRLTGGKDSSGVYNYDNLPEYQKQKNMVFMLGDKVVHVPIPYEVAFAHSAGRYFTDVTEGKMSPWQAVSQTALNLTNNFDPMGSSVPSLLEGVMPSAVRPFYETATNTSWNGQPVHPRAINDNTGEGIVKSQQHFANTNGFFVGLANAMHKATGGQGSYIPGWAEVAPDDMQHIVEAQTGGLGELVAKTGASVGWATNPDAQRAQGREFSPTDVPFVGGFVGKITPGDIGAHYDNLTQPIIQAGESYDHALSSGDMDQASNLMTTRSSQLAAYSEVKDSESQIKALSKSIRDIQQAGGDAADIGAQVQALKGQQDAIRRGMIYTLSQPSYGLAQ